MSSESNPERQRRIRELIAREQEVLESHRAQAPKSYHTGRGGAGSKGHVKVKGKVPNRERALAKEREIQAKWKEARENAGRLKTGRGGRGNIVQAVSSDENSFMTPSRTESRDDTLHLEGPSSAFGVTSSGEDSKCDRLRETDGLTPSQRSAGAATSLSSTSLFPLDLGALSPSTPYKTPRGHHLQQRIIGTRYRIRIHITAW